MLDTDKSVVTRTSLQRRKLRHGFKADAKRLSIEVRRAHGFGDYDPVDCFELARRLGVSLYLVSDFPTDHAHHLLHADPRAFSAATLRSDGRYGVLLNDGQVAERQASNLAHELGHVVLKHEEFPPLNDHGCREHDADIEAEAEYFGSVLLVTDAAVMRVARAGTAIDVAAARYSVSKQMMQWRYNDSGARRRLERERRR
jgi:hypothetical protein